MDALKILEEIVAREGSCSWASADICKRCPLGNSIRSDDGECMSCVEALGIDGLTEQQADAIYKEAALSKIADLALDRVIKED